MKGRENVDNFTIAITHTSGEAAGKLKDILNGQTEALAIGAEWECRVSPGGTEVRCRKADGGRWNAADRKKLYRESSRGLARFILEEEEEKLLRSLFRRDYDYASGEEQSRLLGFCRSLPEDTDGKGKKDAAAALVKTMAREIEECLREFGGLHVNGLLDFRLRDYREYLRELADFAVDEYLLDKQYQEFISLLKYFVLIQQSKIPSVHLLHKGGGDFTLLDEKLKPIDPAAAERITVETLENELNFEDLIVSTLITVAPERIYIHTKEPELPVVRTILQIFDQRAALCSCDLRGTAPRNRTPG